MKLLVGLLMKIIGYVILTAGATLAFVKARGDYGLGIVAVALVLAMFGEYIHWTSFWKTTFKIKE